MIKRRDFLKGTTLSLAGYNLSARAMQEQSSWTDITQEMLDQEVQRSNPDYILYAAKEGDPALSRKNRGQNQHVLVFDGSDGSLLAIWTQKQHVSFRIMFTRSIDEGKSWASPRQIAGPPNDTRPDKSASWAFPVVTARGRVYVFWIGYTKTGMIPFHSGPMLGIYSDDVGQTWSKPQPVRLWKNSPYDDPEGKIPPSWVVWQIPFPDLQRRPYVGFQHPISDKVALGNQDDRNHCNAVVEFMRFENMETHPEPRDIQLSFFGRGEKALRAPIRDNPLYPLLQEPSIVRLPDKRLFCVMRSNTGYIWYSISNDDGENWCIPRPLLRKDYGAPVLSPVNSTPIYQLSTGQYVLMHNNNPGIAPPNRPKWYLKPRYPWYLALGEYRADAEQPIWFSDSKVFLDHGGHMTQFGLGAIGNYGSFTSRGGNDVYWYQDRYCFLLGKKITSEFLSDFKIPKY
jgi:hypothetical protein